MSSIMTKFFIKGNQLELHESAAQLDFLEKSFPSEKTFFLSSLVFVIPINLVIFNAGNQCPAKKWLSRHCLLKAYCYRIE